MAQMVAAVVADGQVVLVAVAAFAERLNVLKRGLCMRHRLTAHPTRDHAMQLARNGFVNLVTCKLEAAHGLIF